MKKSVLKFLPLMAAMIFAASCGNNDKDPVTPQPSPSESTTKVTDKGDGTFIVPFSVKVRNGNSLSKKMEYSEGEDGIINIKFVVGINDEEKLRVSGNGVTGELGLKGKLDDETMSTIYFFYGDLKLTDGVTPDDLDQGNIDLNYEYGTALAEPASSNESLLDLVQHCNHLYKGTATSDKNEITLTDQNTYLAITMSPCCDHDIKINDKKFTVEKSKDGRLWIAVPSGKDVTSEELGLSQSAENVLPSVCHKVARQFFSVGVNKKVYFSSGNLKYKTSDGKYYFADYQSWYMGNTQANLTCTGVFDLFCWGTGNSPTSPHESRSSFSDWGSKIGGGWYTLSHNEWEYLLGIGSEVSRTNASQLRQWGNVNGVNGLIILPDGYNTDGIDWTAWSILESAGAVFLPAAGRRDGTSDNLEVGLTKISGFYWSSSASDGRYAWRFWFSSNNVYSDTNYPRDCGLSVRLVRAL